MARRTRMLSALALAAAAALVPVQATAQQAGQQPGHRAAAPPGTPCAAPVKPASQMAVESCDSPERIIEKAANIVPTPANSPGSSAKSPPSPTSA